MAKNTIHILGLLLLAMVVLNPSKVAATRNYPEISSNSKAEKWERNDGSLYKIEKEACVKLCCSAWGWACICCQKLSSTEKISKSNGNEVEGSGGIGRVKLLGAPGQ
ncbi:hypothetical protein HN51_005631 [Arachis hypogaea]|uniref:Uncharacterized protein LOC107485495 n=1 Tax=Arachis duranensis TaxID=130453 RepID=A0A6P4D3G3_ARADU|nr:uncharacterized protein LOC107485495 [Arachis duranensis]XP_025692221.1 uncharacterized protein LOC112794402 [Arachis hypogaea]QHO39410.1 uncharacterized protein DS421_4g128920 [Arachis hypogaea]